MSPDNVIYLDNAATSFPKPREVTDAVCRFMTEIGGNPGRSGHRLSVEAGEAVFAARELCAGLFGVRNPMRVAFSANATESLNLAIQGILRPGDHAVTTSMEHNGTARPLRELEKRGIITLTILPCPGGFLDLRELESSITPTTALAVVNHGSNVFGTVQPVAEAGAICRGKGVPLLVDAAQTAGIIPVDMERDNIDLLAFTGHKALYGPAGTGGLVIGERFDFGRMRPLTFGGTGSRSDSIEQPEFLPDRYESGTLNAAGLAGLAAGISFLLSLPGGPETVRKHKNDLGKSFDDGARSMVQGYRSYVRPEDGTGVISFNIDGIEPSEAARRLSDDFGIMCRAGLHCAPLAHETMKTFPAGTVRFGFGIFNTPGDVRKALKALAEISEKGR